MWLSLELKLHVRRAHCGSHRVAERQEEGSRDHDTSFGYYSKTNKTNGPKIESLDPAQCSGKLKTRTPRLFRLAARSSWLAGGQTLNWKQYLLNRFVEE